MPSAVRVSTQHRGPTMRHVVRAERNPQQPHMLRCKAVVGCTMSRTGLVLLLAALWPKLAEKPGSRPVLKQPEYEMQVVAADRQLPGTPSRGSQ